MIYLIKWKILERKWARWTHSALSLSHETSFQFAILANGCWDGDEHRNAQEFCVVVAETLIIMIVNTQTQLRSDASTCKLSTRPLSTFFYSARSPLHNHANLRREKVKDPTCTRGEKIEGSESFSPLTMRFHYNERFLHRCVRFRCGHSGSMWTSWV